MAYADSVWPCPHAAQSTPDGTGTYGTFSSAHIIRGPGQRVVNSLFIKDRDPQFSIRVNIKFRMDDKI